MRLLFAVPPGLAHLFPMVPLARATLAAGHEVLVATTGPAVTGAIDAGLLATDVAPEGPATRSYTRLAEVIVNTELSGAEVATEVIQRFGEVGALMVDGIIEVANRWRADTILYPPALPAGLLGARVADVPAILHGIALRQPTLDGAMEHLTGAAESHGLAKLPREPDVELNVSPASLEEPVAETWPMRYESYNGGAELPPWLFGNADRPRVVVTFGSMAATLGDGEMLARIIEGAHDMGVELILTSAGASLPALPEPLPAHVRLVEWLPLNALLVSAHAIVHHGGAGSVFSSLAAGVPQLVVPHGGDRPHNATLVANSGAGVALGPADGTPSAIGKALGLVLHGGRYHSAAAAVAAEMAAMPAPSTVVDRLSNQVVPHFVQSG